MIPSFEHVKSKYLKFSCSQECNNEDLAEVGRELRNTEHNPGSTYARHRSPNNMIFTQ